MKKVLLKILLTPSIWYISIRQLFVLAPNGWWRHKPFLPIPDKKYMEFRMMTAYGDPHAKPIAQDIVAYLRWVKAFNKHIKISKKGSDVLYKDYNSKRLNDN